MLWWKEANNCNKALDLSVATVCRIICLESSKLMSKVPWAILVASFKGNSEEEMPFGLSLIQLTWLAQLLFILIMLFYIWDDKLLIFPETGKRKQETSIDPHKQKASGGLREWSLTSASHTALSHEGFSEAIFLYFFTGNTGRNEIPNDY